ncbi:MAG: YhbY family RNA-binding protein [Polyangiales bacterium]|nr:YhbY family RNA-binding protein [Myxococcales bacterium]
MPTERHPAELTGAQRRGLRALAHDLDPVLIIGKDGIDDDVLSALHATLARHELVKVRVLESAPVDRHAAATSLAAGTMAHEVGTIGRIVILYRRHPTDPKVPLRSRS